MTGKRISVITVCYNSEKTLEKTLQSVSAQQYQNKEHLVIDGGSIDSTRAILTTYSHQIQQCLSEPDAGIYDAMNKGIMMATGDIIGLLNADDLYADPTVLTQVAQVFEDPNVHACYGDLMYFSNRKPHKIIRYWKSSSYEPGLFAKGWSPPHPTFFVRKSIYLKYGLFDLSYVMGNDVELMMRFLEKHQIVAVYIPRVLVKMRSGGVSNRSFKNIVLQNREVLKAAKNCGISHFTHNVLGA